MSHGHRTGENPTLTIPSIHEITDACQAKCRAPDGWATKLQEQVDKWRGAIGLGSKVLAVALTLIAATVAIGVASVPSLVRSSARQGVREEVRAAVAEEFVRHFGSAAAPGNFSKDLASASAWHVVPAAQAADVKGP